MRKQRGFTLIELLVVIAIIAILATLVITQLGGAQTKARNSNAKSDITQLGKAVETYKADKSVDYVVQSVKATGNKAGTYLQASGATGGWGALFNAANTYPVTVNKTPSASYVYGYATDGGAGTANLQTTAAVWAAAPTTASAYCIGTNTVKPQGGDESAFYFSSGATANGTSTVSSVSYDSAISGYHVSYSTTGTCS